MDNLILSIDCKDSEYEYALARAIQRNSKTITVKLKDRKGDIVITDKPYMRGESVFMLRENRYDCHRKGCKNLYKYDNVRTMVKAVEHEYAKEKGVFINLLKESDTDIFTFFSKHGGVGTTSLALAYAQEIQRFKSKKTLYISLSCFDDIKEYIKPVDGSGIRQFLYYLNEENEEECNLLDSFLIKSENNVSAFNPHIGINPICRMKLDDYCIFLKRLRECREFDSIVVDGGSLPLKKLFYTLGISTRCFEVTRAEYFIDGMKRFDIDNYYQEKIKEYENRDFKTIVNMCMTGEEDHIKETITRDFGQKEQERPFFAIRDKVKHDKEYDEARQTFGDSGNIFFVKYDPESFSFENGIRKIDYNKTFGLFVKNLSRS